jgi:archaellum component FlaC
MINIKENDDGEFYSECSECGATEWGDVGVTHKEDCNEIKKITEKYPLFINDLTSFTSTNMIGSVDIEIKENAEKIVKEIKDGSLIILPELIKDLKTGEFKLTGFHLTMRGKDEL